MAVELKYTDDVIIEYSNKRPTVTYEDTEDLMKVFIKYLKHKMKSHEAYAIKTPLGIFYKKFNEKLFDSVDNPLTHEQIINEKLFLNNCIKKKILKEYTYEDIEIIKEHTNK